LERNASTPQSCSSADTVVNQAAPLGCVTGAPSRAWHVEKGVGEPCWHADTELWEVGVRVGHSASRPVGCNVQGECMALRVVNRNAPHAGMQGGQHTPLTGMAREGVGKGGGGLQHCTLPAATPPPLIGCSSKA
jgi:hypothetical protein